MKIEIDLSNITVTLQEKHLDAVFVELKLPAAYDYNPAFRNLLLLEFKTKEGQGIEYVRKNFGVDPAINIHDGNCICSTKKTCEKLK